jgi:Family of unknown function (DUF6527)
MDRLKVFIAKLFASKNDLHVVALVAKPSRVPDELPRNGVVLTGASLKNPAWILFDCPCGRGHRAMLNLSPKERPVWKASGLRRLTLNPSVDDLSIDRCHYWVRDGRIDWA